MSGIIEVPDAWRTLSARIDAEGGLTLLLGTSDSGKTTLARWLLGALSAAGRRVAFVDGDIGQSTLGPPATAGLALATPTSTDPNPRPISLRFVGAVSPAEHMLPLAVALKRLAGKAHAMGAQILLVDTTGLVLGPVGCHLKFHKIELLAPQHLVAVQRDRELEPILRLFEGRKGMAISRLSVSPHVTPRSPQARRTYRAQRFFDYFQASSSLELSLHDVGIQGSWVQGGRELDRSELQGLLLGLADAENELLALGLLQDLDPATGRLLCLTPLADRATVRIVHFGSLRLEPSGQELGEMTLDPVTL